MSRSHARRVAALYDIHGNISALDAVLEELSELDVDLIVVGGDLVWGPFPEETLQRLLGLGDRALFIRGNADREVGESVPSQPTDELGPQAAVTEFCAERLSREQLDWLKGLPTTATVEIEGLGTVVFCHASPRSDDEILTPKSSDERLREAAKDLRGLIVCGHTHVQFDHDLGDIRLVNAGSVGMPYEDLPGAYWTLLGPELTPKHTSYAVEEAVSAIRASGCPYAEEYFVDPLLNSPGREDALAHFAERAARS